LASRNFRLLVGCDVMSMAGTAMATVAVPFAVLRSGGSASDIGFVTVAGLVPTIVFLLLGGVVADRLPRQRVMVLANVVQGGMQAAFALLVLTGRAHLIEMMLLTAGRGVAFGFYMPAAQGLLPQTVGGGDLASANAIRRLGLNAAQISGAAFGGIVVAVVGPGWGLVGDAVSYAAAAALRTGMRFGDLPPVTRTGLLPELRAGWRAVASRRWLWVVVVEFAFVNALYAGGFSVLGPVVAQHRLGGASSWGVIVAGQSLGAVLGAALMLRYRPARLLGVGNLAVATMALPLICLAVPLGLPFVATAALLGGMGAEAFEINWSIALQENVPVTLLSRVSAYDALGSYALGPVGTTVAGPLAALVGTTVALGGAGIAILVAVAVTLGLPDVRRLTRRVADTGAVIADVPLDPATGAIELRPASEGEVRDAAR
jgi:MFS family permease